MLFKLDTKMFFLLKRVKRQVAERLGVDKVTFCLDISTNGSLYIEFISDVEETFARLEFDGNDPFNVSDLLNRFMNHDDVEWSDSEDHNTAEDYNHDDWCYDCDNDYYDCKC